MNEELKVIISAEIGNFKSRVATAKKEIADFGSKVKSYSKNIDTDMKAIGKSIGSGLKTAGVAVAGAATALLALAGTTQEYNTEQAKLITAFEAQGASAATARDTYVALNRVMGDSGAATEAAQQLAQISAEEAKLSEYTFALQGVYAQFGSTLPIESLAEAANETINVGTVTGSFADALNWAQVSSEQWKASFEGHPKALATLEAALNSGMSAEDAFNEALTKCRTEGEREQVVRQTLTALYGDAAAAYEETAGAILAQNEAQDALTSTLGDVGAAMTPVLTAFTMFATQALDAVRPYIEDLAAVALPALQAALDAVVYSIEAGIPWIEENIGLISVIAGIIGGIVAAIGLYNAVAAVKAAMDAAQVTTLGGLIAAQLAHTAAIAAALAPYLLIIAAVAALVAGFLYLWENCDGFREFWIDLWAKMKEIFSQFVETLRPLIESIVGAFKEGWATIQVAWSVAAPYFLAIWNAIKAAFTPAAMVLGGFFKAAWVAIQTAWSVATAYFTTIFNTIKRVFSVVKAVLSGNFSDAWAEIKNIFRDWGSFFSKLWETVRKAFGNIKKSISDAITGAKDKVSDIIDNIKNLLGLDGFSWSLPKPSFPSFSISGGKAPWGFMGEGSLPKISIKWNAMGGVFENPTVRHFGNTLQGLAENGAEAIVPLENNLGWLDKLAGMLNERMGADRPIVLSIDGKVFAQTTINSINSLTRQTGHLGLNLV